MLIYYYCKNVKGTEGIYRKQKIKHPSNFHYEKFLIKDLSYSIGIITNNKYYLKLMSL